MRIYQYPLTLLILLVLSSCVHMAVRDGAGSIEKQVTAFWAAKVQGEWGKAYTFLCNDARAQTSEADFIRSAGLRISTFTVGAIDREAEGKKAVVTVSFNAVAMGFELKGVTVKDEWIYEDGAWNICPRPGGAKALFEKK